MDICYSQIIAPRQEMVYPVYCQELKLKDIGKVREESLGEQCVGCNWVIGKLLIWISELA